MSNPSNPDVTTTDEETDAALAREEFARIRGVPFSALHDAALHGNAASVIATLDRGVPVDDLHQGASALHWATATGKQEIVRILLDRGADPNLLGDSENTPLHGALSPGLQLASGPPVVRLLLEYGADPNLAVDGDDVPIVLAAREGSIEALTLLLNFGADINGAGASGVTALIAAHTDMECARFLLQRGADPNVRPKSGWTPLHFAIHAASPGMVQLLIEAGADANSRNNDGKSLLAFASKQNDSVIVELLRAAGARWNNSE